LEQVVAWDVYDHQGTDLKIAKFLLVTRKARANMEIKLYHSLTEPSVENVEVAQGGLVSPTWVTEEETLDNVTLPPHLRDNLTCLETFLAGEQSPAHLTQMQKSHVYGLVYV